MYTYIKCASKIYISSSLPHTLQLQIAERFVFVLLVLFVFVFDRDPGTHRSVHVPVYYYTVNYYTVVCTGAGGSIDAVIKWNMGSWDIFCVLLLPTISRTATARHGQQSRGRRRFSCRSRETILYSSS